MHMFKAFLIGMAVVCYSTATIAAEATDGDATANDQLPPRVLPALSPFEPGAGWVLKSPLYHQDKTYVLDTEHFQALLKGASQDSFSGEFTLLEEDDRLTFFVRRLYKDPSVSGSVFRDYTLIYQRVLWDQRGPDEESTEEEASPAAAPVRGRKSKASRMLAVVARQKGIENSPKSTAEKALISKKKLRLPPISFRHRIWNFLGTAAEYPLDFRWEEKEEEGWVLLKEGFLFAGQCYRISADDMERGMALFAISDGCTQGVGEIEIVPGQEGNCLEVTILYRMGGTLKEAPQIYEVLYQQGTGEE